MSPRVPPTLAVLLLACAGTAGTAPAVTSDASTDASTDAPHTPHDVAVDAAEAGADVADVAADVGDDEAPPGPGPIDGAWRVTDILCAGAPASAAARAFITAPNASEFSVASGRSTYTLRTPTCVLRLESTVTYPSPGRAVFTARGPFTCVPAGCMAGCETTPALPYVYEHSMRGDALVMRTVGATSDITCTASGQQNPITYTYARTR